MKAPAFWWRAEGGWPAVLLAPAAAIYGAAATRRMARPGVQAGIPVICIGNFTVGGAGKTPLALHVGQDLVRRGLKPAFLTRGYGGRLAGPLVVEGDRHRAVDVGDEPLLLDTVATTIVARDRVAGARLAQDLGANVLVMDDGLQNPSLAKTLRLAAVDAGAGIGNGRCLPAGPLRAPLETQLAQVDALVVIGDGAAGEAVASRAGQHDKSVLRARLLPDPEVAARLAGRKVLAFAGIGRPEKFFETLRSVGADVVASRAFGDHAPLSAAACRDLMDTARREGLLLVTTAKDHARMAGAPEQAALMAAATVLPVSLVLDSGDEAQLAMLLTGALGASA